MWSNSQIGFPQQLNKLHSRVDCQPGHSNFSIVDLQIRASLVPRRIYIWEYLSALNRKWDNNESMLFERKRFMFAAVAACTACLVLILAASGEDWHRSFLPVLAGSEPSLVEVRALWVTRFDWTTSNGADSGKIDEIVENASEAGFNALFFQVRGEADAYYSSSVEPWASRLGGGLGKDPGWDPLGYMIQKAHSSGLQVHAYLNVYPLWTGCGQPPSDTSPEHLFHKLVKAQGTTDGMPNSVQWNSAGEIICEPYWRVSPASTLFDDHFMAVIDDLATHYDIDGIHLDHIRYAGALTSCDPVSESRYGAPCSVSADYANWQREQINRLVGKIYDQLLAKYPHLWLTAAVWPVYRDTYGWGATSGYDTYYQDSQAWMQGDYVDGISPMIYTGSPNCSGPYFWTRERWETLAAEFQMRGGGNFVLPGIGTAFCTDNDFAEIAARIEIARSKGTAGHAIFSYSGLLLKEYFDDLARGPYVTPARMPALPRR
jgi:uncharacterized lipoprotein YddW (UPF0748 family)